MSSNKKIAVAAFFAMLIATLVSSSQSFGAETIPAPQIFSSTHPNQNKWYREKIGQLSWNLPTGTIAISYALDQNPTGTITGAYRIANSIETPPLPEGVSYFHLRLRKSDGWSDTANYTLRIDTVTPGPFAIQFLDGTSTRNFSPKISFAAEDSGSGIQKYEVYLDGNLTKTIDSGGEQTLGLPLARAGTYFVEVKAFDAAGNASIADGSIVLNGLPDKFISRVLLISGFLLLIIIAFLFLPGASKRKAFGVRESETNPAIILENKFKILQSDFDKIKQDLLYLAKFRSSQKIFSYVEMCHKQGLPDSVIRGRLEKSGWQGADIEGVFKECEIFEKINTALKKNIKDIDLGI